MPRILKVSPEFLVNTSIGGDQFSANSLPLDDGRFIVVWRDQTDGVNETIRAQFFASDGTKLGDEFQIDPAPGDKVGKPDITLLSDGRFVVSWSSLSTPGNFNTSDVFGRIFESDGTASGGVFQLNQTTAKEQSFSSITALGDGQFVAVWFDMSGKGGDTSESAIRGQVFNADGSWSGGQFLVNSTTLGYQYSPDVAALDGGNFVVVWADWNESGSDSSDIRCQVFTQNGSKKGNELVVSRADSEYTIYGDNAPKVVSLAGGGFAVAWFETDIHIWSGIEHHLTVRVFDADGTPVQEYVDYWIIGFNSADQSLDLDVTALSDGGFLATFSASSYDGYDGTWYASVQAVRFDGAGDSVANVTLAQQVQSGTETDVFIGFTGVDTTTLADGRVLVTWTDEVGTGDDTSGSSVHARILDPRESAVQLNGTLGNDQYVGTVFGDSILGSFGNDTLIGASGDDNLSGEYGNDSLIGGAGNDRLSGGIDSDTLNGNNGSDVLDGGAGDDSLNGGQGSDAMIGGTGNDIFVVDHNGDLVLEDSGAGIDEVRSASISISLASYLNVENIALTGALALAATGDAAANSIIGNAANNVLIGLAGNDTIGGGAGADVLRGGLGIDRLTGGAGSDRFVFRTAGEAAGDVIVDFAAGSDDVVLSDFMAGGSFIGNAVFSAANQVRYTLATGVLQGDVDGNGTADWSMTLVNRAALTVADFVF